MFIVGLSLVLFISLLLSLPLIFTVNADISQLNAFRINSFEDSSSTAHKEVKYLIGSLRSIENVISNNKHVVIIFPKNYKRLLRPHKIKRPLFVYSKKNSMVKSQIPATDIMFIFSNSLLKVLGNFSWTYNSYFIVFVTKMTDISNVFNIFWSKQIINVIVLKYSDLKVDMYSYFPYNDKSCGIDIKIEKIITWTWGETINSSQLLFPPKMENMHKCNLSVTVLNRAPFVDINSDKYSGIEVDIVESLANSINATAVFTSLYEREWMKKDDFTQYCDNLLLYDLINKSSDLAIGSLMLTKSVSDQIEGLHYYESLCVTLAVPKVGPYSLLSAALHISGIITICLMPLVVLLLKVGFHNQNKKWQRAFKMVLFPLLGFQFKFPKAPSQRIILICWIAYYMMYFKATETLIGSRLIVPYEGKQLETIEDVINNKFLIAGETFLKEEVLPGYNVDASLIVKNKMSAEYSLFVISRFKNIAFLGTTINLKHYISRNLQLKNDVYVQKECAAIYSPILELKKNSPFTACLQKKLLALGELGVIHHLISLEASKTNRRLLRQRSDILDPLTLRDLYWSNIIFLGGMFIGGSVLIAEIIFFRKFNSKTTRKYKMTTLLYVTPRLNSLGNPTVDLNLNGEP